MIAADEDKVIRWKLTSEHKKWYLIVVVWAGGVLQLTSLLHWQKHKLQPKKMRNIFLNQHTLI